MVRLRDGRDALARTFTAGDRHGVVGMFASMSEEALSWGMPPYTRERLDRGWWSNFQNLTALVAEHEGVIVGYAQIMKSPRPRLRGIGEFLIYLHQDYQNVGLGTSMTRIIVGLAKEEGLHRIGLSVVSDNRSAIHIYEKYGFKLEGTCRDAFFGDDGKYHDLIYMGLILD